MHWETEPDRDECERRVKVLMADMLCGVKCSEAVAHDLLSRDLIYTPFCGAYGIAGWVLALEGSPPRGVIVSLETERHRYVPPAIFFLTMDKSRRVGEAQAREVRKFIGNLEEPAIAKAKATDNVTGTLMVGTNQDGEVVVNLDRDRTGHIVFSANQARNLAEILLRKADEAENCVSLTNQAESDA